MGVLETIGATGLNGALEQVTHPGPKHGQSLVCGAWFWDTGRGKTRTHGWVIDPRRDSLSRSQSS